MVYFFLFRDFFSSLYWVHDLFGILATKGLLLLSRTQKVVGVFFRQFINFPYQMDLLTMKIDPFNLDKYP